MLVITPPAWQQAGETILYTTRTLLYTNKTLRHTFYTPEYRHTSHETQDAHGTKTKDVYFDSTEVEPKPHQQTRTTHPMLLFTAPITNGVSAVLCVIVRGKGGGGEGAREGGGGKVVNRGWVLLPLLRRGERHLHRRDGCMYLLWSWVCVVIIVPNINLWP